MEPIDTTNREYQRSLSSSALSPIAHAERLYTTPRWIPKKVKGPDDSLVCDLPSTTLRWIKKRRTMTSDQKVVLSHQRERQLREMFQSLDYTNQGEIDLSALTDAVAYVQEKTKHMKGMKEFQNLQEVFSSMDDNGDGTIDFQEFTNGMTGTTQSAFDKANEYDIDRLFRYFVEFGELRQRQIALKKLNVTKDKGGNVGNRDQSNYNNNNDHRPQTVPMKATGFSSKTEFDLNSYQQFKVLFGNNKEEKNTSSNLTISASPKGGVNNHNNLSSPNVNMMKSKSSSDFLTHAPVSQPATSHTVASMIAAEKANAVEIRKLQKLEKLLDEFVHEQNVVPSRSSLASKSTHSIHAGGGEFDEKKFQEYLQVQDKLKEARREEYEALGKHYNDAIFIEQRALADKKALQALQTPKSKAVLKASIDPNSRKLPALSTSQELNLRFQARKDAFQILRMSPSERRAVSTGNTPFGYSSAFGTSNSKIFEETDNLKPFKLATDSMTVMSVASEVNHNNYNNHHYYQQQQQEPQVRYEIAEGTASLRNSISAPTNLTQLPFEMLGRSNSTTEL